MTSSMAGVRWDGVRSMLRNLAFATAFLQKKVKTCKAYLSYENSFIKGGPRLVFIFFDGTSDF
jgi:hypothetical protein